jgi:hypothetical protein
MKKHSYRNRFGEACKQEDSTEEGMMGKQGSVLKHWRFFCWGLGLLAALVGLGVLTIQVSPGFALSILLLVLVWGLVIAYLFNGYKRLARRRTPTV